MRVSRIHSYQKELPIDNLVQLCPPYDLYLKYVYRCIYTDDMHANDATMFNYHNYEVHDNTKLSNGN